MLSVPMPRVINSTCHGWVLWLHSSEEMRCPALKGMPAWLLYYNTMKNIIVFATQHCSVSTQEMNFYVLDLLWILCDFCPRNLRNTALFVLLNDAMCNLNRWKQLDYSITVTACSLNVEIHKEQITECLYHLKGLSSSHWHRDWGIHMKLYFLNNFWWK